MKRLFITLFAAFIVTITNAKSDVVESVSVNIGGYPAIESLIYGSPFYYDMPIRRPLLENLYSDKKGPMFSTGTISVQTDFNVKKWLSIPMILTGNGIFQKCTSPIDDKSYFTTNFTSQLFSGFRFKYMNRKNINFYSMICFGTGIASDDYYHQVVFDNGEEVVERIDRGHNFELIPGFQIVPFGVRFGGKIYGTAEIGIGTMYIGGMVGIGIKL